MIIQTGMRTDIPAFYSEWLVNRIKEKYVLVRNPYNPSQVTKYSLSPDVVDLIAFCTKNPAPMLPYMDVLKPAWTILVSDNHTLWQRYRTQCACQREGNGKFQKVV